MFNSVEDAAADELQRSDLAPVRLVVVSKLGAVPVPVVMCADVSLDITPHSKPQQNTVVANCYPMKLSVFNTGVRSVTAPPDSTIIHAWYCTPALTYIVVSPCFFPLS